MSHLENAFGFSNDVGRMMFAMNIARLPPSLQEGLIRVTPTDLRKYAANFIEARCNDSRVDVVNVVKMSTEEDEDELEPRAEKEAVAADLVPFDDDADAADAADAMKWRVINCTSIPPVIAFRALLRAGFLDAQVTAQEIRAMCSFVTGDEFLISFNRMGMMHMMPEMAFGLICLKSLSSMKAIRHPGGETRTVERLVHQMLCKVSDIALNFSKRHLSLRLPCALCHALLEEAKAGRSVHSRAAHSFT